MAMPRSAQRTYSTMTKVSGQLLGSMIRRARIERQMTAEDLAERAGVSRGLLHRIEKGYLSVSLGAALELAVIAGVPVFGGDLVNTNKAIGFEKYLASLLPSTVRSKHDEVDDDF